MQNVYQTDSGVQVRQGVKYVHRVHRGQFDWFMRIDDEV